VGDADAVMDMDRKQASEEHSPHPPHPKCPSTGRHLGRPGAGPSSCDLLPPIGTLSLQVFDRSTTRDETMLWPPSVAPKAAMRGQEREAGPCGDTKNELMLWCQSELQVDVLEPCAHPIFQSSSLQS